MAKEYKVDGVVADVIGIARRLRTTKPWLKKEMDKRDLPLLELGLVYGEKGSGQMRRGSRGFAWRCCKTDKDDQTVAQAQLVEITLKNEGYHASQ